MLLKKIEEQIAENLGWQEDTIKFARELVLVFGNPKSEFNGVKLCVGMMDLKLNYSSSEAGERVDVLYPYDDINITLSFIITPTGDVIVLEDEVVCFSSLNISSRLDKPDWFNLIEEIEVYFD